MKTFFTLLNFFTLFAISAQAQSLTGGWRGYFIRHHPYYGKQYYDEEVQLLQSSQAVYKGISYSYTNDNFCTKSPVTGFYKPDSSVLILRTTKNIHGDMVACLIIYYLHHRIRGKLEILTGTYTTVNPMNNSVCESGEIYLGKDPVSHFNKGKLLIDVENEEQIKQKILAKKKSELFPQSVPDKTYIKNEFAKASKIKSNVENKVTKVFSNKIIMSPTVDTSFGNKTIKAEESEDKIPTPDVLRNRCNEIAKTLSISSSKIKIDLYDNGIVDGDTISVYDNNQLIISKKRLTGKPISFTYKADTTVPAHAFTMIAENLGSIPPNTALMVITAGTKRYEVFLTSTKQKNAVIIIEYKPTD